MQKNKKQKKNLIRTNHSYSEGQADSLLMGIRNHLTPLFRLTCFWHMVPVNKTEGDKIDTSSSVLPKTEREENKLQRKSPSTLVILIILLYLFTMWSWLLIRHFLPCTYSNSWLALLFSPIMQHFDVTEALSEFQSISISIKIGRKKKYC